MKSENSPRDALPDLIPHDDEALDPIPENIVTADTKWPIDGLLVVLLQLHDDERWMKTSCGSSDWRSFWLGCGSVPTSTCWTRTSGRWWESKPSQRSARAYAPVTTGRPLVSCRALQRLRGRPIGKGKAPQTKRGEVASSWPCLPARRRGRPAQLSRGVAWAAELQSTKTSGSYLTESFISRCTIPRDDTSLLLWTTCLRIVLASSYRMCPRTFSKTPKSYPLQ